MWHPWIGRSVRLAAVVIGLLAVPSADAKTFVADPSIPDTTEASSCTSPCALRQAIGAAEAAEKAAFGGFSPEAETIELPVGTYTLTKGPLRVVHEYSAEHEPYPLTIVGRGARADEVVIAAGGKSRVLIDGRGGGSTGLVVLKRLEITGGNGEGGIVEEPLEPEKGEGGGIAIEQNGTLKLDEVLLEGNTAAVEGGGIEDVGELTVEDSTIAHNTVTGGRGLGGGISSDNLNSESHEAVKIVNSTLAFNSVSGGSSNEGSAIFNGTVLELTNSTLSGNSAPGSGGALAGFENVAVPNMGVSTIANDVIAYDKGGGCEGKIPTSLGGNDVSDLGCELSNQKKTNDISADPGLEKESAETPKLADNGGPTETIAIGSSLAPPVKNGLEQDCPATDQRGAARPSHTDCSSGAYQYGTTPSAIVSGSVTPTGAGTVTAKSKIMGADCSEAECTVPAQESGKVDFTETPASGFGFVEWIGCGKIASGACEVENDGSNQSVTAKFAARFTVTADTSTAETAVSAKSSAGDASCTATSCMVDEGDAVTLTAESKNPGLQFVGWSGGSCGAQNPCKLEHVKAGETDTANFELGPPSSPPVGTVLIYFDSGAPGEGNGTQQSPYRSVRAIEPLLERREEEIAREHGEVSPLELLFADGEYEGLEFTSAKKISVYGDLSPATWKAERAPAEPTRFAGTPQGLLLNGSSEMSFQQVTFQGRAPFSSGASAYGVRMIGGSQATFADVTAEAENGRNGANGGVGAQGAEGAAGGAGGQGSTPGEVRSKGLETGGLFFGQGDGAGGGGCPGLGPYGNYAALSAEGYQLGGAAACPGVGEISDVDAPGDGGAGGNGGELDGSLGYGYPGIAGSPAIVNNADAAAGGALGDAGESEGTWCCENPHGGLPGSAGGSGGPGSGGDDEATTSPKAGGLYEPSAGASGSSGQPGGGGGGGGGGSGDFDGVTNGGGDAGGGGGSGGLGGGGGAGGVGGGGSFGIYLVGGSHAVFDYSSSLASGEGGEGGEGGNGGTGGPGGAGGKGSSYAASSIGTGGNGGAGGGGGPGGPGGGGLGGPSYAVFADAHSGVELAVGTTQTAGAVGGGGEPGGPGGRPAERGGGGPSSPCSAHCTVSAQLPVAIPPTATISGGVVTVGLGCVKPCKGKMTLTGELAKAAAIAPTGQVIASKKAHGAHEAVLGRLSFSLPAAKRVAKLHIRLSAVARKRLKGLEKGFPATLTVELRLGKAKKATRYTQTIELLPPAAGKPPKAK
jgi:hypothetical protein